MMNSTRIRNYILNITQITESELDLVGDRALNLSYLTKLGAPTLKGFIVTSKVFDDFLFANNLIVQISEINAQLERGNISLAQAEKLIKNLIIEAKFPNLVYEMLYRAYDLLVAGKAMKISLHLSFLNAELKESMSRKEGKLIIADNFDNFLIQLKNVWLDLFTQDVLEYRLSNSYKGVISTAVVVNKFIQPEISGTVYTLSIENANPNIIETRAVYGTEHDTVYRENFVDRYLYDRNTEELVHKVVSNQKWMVVVDGLELGFLPLAPIRQGVQKLADNQILSLSKISSNLKTHFKNELKIDWQFQAGQFIFTNFSRLREQDIINARQLLLQLKPGDKLKKISKEERFSFNKDPYLQPLDKLTKVLSGEGNNRGLVYGRVKLIQNAIDLQKVKGDTILVLSKPLQNLAIKQVKYKGVVVENDFESDKLELPVIKKAKDAFNLLLENEVITLDTDSGAIYLGAGYLPVIQNKTESQIDTIQANMSSTSQIKLTMQKPARGSIFKNVLEQRESLELDWLPQEEDSSNFHVIGQDNKDALLNGEESTSIITNSLQEEWYLKNPVYKPLVNEIESGNEYWQIINLENPVVLENTKGVYFRLNQIIKLLDIDLYELIRNKPSQRKFIEFCLNYFKQYESSSQVFVNLDMSMRDDSMDKKDELLEIQIEIVKYLRNKAGLRNISIVLSEIDNERELTKAKKLITANGLRRSSTFSLLVELSSPLSIISVQKLIDSGVDGLVLDLDKLLISLAVDNTHNLTPEISEFISGVVSKINMSAVPLLILVDEILLTEDNLEQLVKSGIIKFIFPEAKIRELGVILASMDIKLLSKNTSKKGRKQKPINYGF